MNLTDIKYVYFLGIGGIGMSAIARYFNSIGISVSGYDKTPSPLTEELIKEGISITFEDSANSLPAFISEYPAETLLIYTPAIPKDHRQFNDLTSKGLSIYKRSEVLGMISQHAFCIAVAGTHGKTTTSTWIAHLLNECGINFTAFLGGISANYNTNYLHKTDGRSPFADKPIVVLEADEFDRSFHRLNPDIAIITAIDPDHLDIYENEEAFREAFGIFATKIKSGGTLIYHHSLTEHWPENITCISYGTDTQESKAMSCSNVKAENGHFTFDLTGHFTAGEAISIRHLKSGLNGFHNIENATAASTACLLLPGIEPEMLRAGISTYRGAKRRFEYIINTETHVVIDDYAHHPEELNAIIGSVRALYPNRTITGVFQPHLFSRTRDFGDAFADSLDKLDYPILLDIYPARELPIPGIDGQWLLNKMKNPNKQLLDNDALLQLINQTKPSLLLILGAGDIDRLVPKIKTMYHGI